MNQAPSLVWLRLDLRLVDNPALHAAVQRGGAVVPVFIWAPEEEGDWSPGEASRWWLHQSLARLAADFRSMGVPLIIRRGPSGQTLRTLVDETGARAVFWNRRYEPAVIQRDSQVERELLALGCVVETFNANLLLDPWPIRNKSNKPFQVFTAFWRSCGSSLDPAEPLPAPRKLIALRSPPKSQPLAALELEPRSNWASGIAARWQPGEAGAAKLLRMFCKTKISSYRIERDRPDQDGTSRLSPHLHFGEIGPRQIWHAITHNARERGLSSIAWKRNQFITELGWREFAHHLLCHFPQTPIQPLRREFKRFPWRNKRRLSELWARGKTGYPLVDAGMRELWTTGWMHNRVRMVAASFLVKDLLLSWRSGARWFWNTLVDADLANNTLGWQWTAGCGADPAPFFRIFNAVSQGEKFDPNGEYVRRWVPELARLPNRWIHKPWLAPHNVLMDAGVELGTTYPKPIVDHSAARQRALDAFTKMKAPAFPHSRPSSSSRQRMRKRKRGT
jgi:deoxyribodipyrimidine photo-lyase